MMNSHYRRFPPTASLILVAAIALLALLSVAAHQSLAQTAPPAAAADLDQTWTFSGKVFDGATTGDESKPIAGVTVQLYCSQNANEQYGTLLATTVTDANGWYSLSTGATCEYYNIVETDPSGYTSVGAKSVSGTVKGPNWIQFTQPIRTKDLTGNKFWDRSPTATRTNTPTRTATRTTTRAPTSTRTRTAEPTLTRTPTRVPGTSLTYTKRLTSPSGPIVVSDTVTFEIIITNNGNTTITNYNASDSYPTTHLTFVSAVPPANDSIDDGVLEWTGLQSRFGNLAPGQTVSIVLTFHAKAPTTSGPIQNCGSAYIPTTGDPVIVIPVCVDVTIGQRSTTLQMDKRLLPPTAPVVSDTVTFEIVITNTGQTTLAPLRLDDTYPTGYLSYLGATPPSDDNIDDGTITWTDLTTFFGPIAPGQKVTVLVHFHAKADTGLMLTQNCATLSVPINQQWSLVVAYDCEMFAVAPRLPRMEVDKILLGPPVVCVSDTVEFAVVVTNTGQTPISSADTKDMWYPVQLRPLMPAAPNTGQIVMPITWWPDLPPGASFSLHYAFHAEGPANPAINTFVITPTASGVAGLPVGDEAGVIIEQPGPCSGNAVVNGGFESAIGPEWHLGGSGVAPVRVSTEKHSGAYSLRLGDPLDLPIPNAHAGESLAYQEIAIPNNVAHAELSFWYRMQTAEGTSKYDGFISWTTQGLLGKVLGPGFLGNTQWVHETRDLTPYRGSSVKLVFLLYQDGIFPTTLWLDDVEVCFSSCGPNGGNNPPPPGSGPFCWKERGFVDYAPAGVPDFDQKQDNWTTASGAWTYDAPVAVANSLWWYDSKFEMGTTPPPAVSDHYGLVGAYGQWDDHDARNVQPLVQDLATRMSTNVGHTGTLPVDVQTGILDYLQSKQLAISYTVTLQEQPSFDWVRDEVRRSEDVTLLLGFWELQQDGWKRLGGHYVTAAGVSCGGDMLAISDPWRDNAEQGGMGYVSLLPPPHPHTATITDTVHNDAKYVSHDLYSVYAVMTPGGRWALAGYAEAYRVIANFFGANVPGPLREFQAEGYGNGRIVTVVERAIAVSPVPGRPILRVEPRLSHAAEGEIIEVAVMVDGAGQQADMIAAYLDFDPALLTVVDPAGNSISQAIPGPEFPVPMVNSVNNDTGQVDVVYHMPNGMELAKTKMVFLLRLKALVRMPAYGTVLAFSSSGERRTQILRNGEPILGSASGGVVYVNAPVGLMGKVGMQGRPTPPDPSYITHLALSMHDEGATDTLAAFAVATDDHGRFEVGGVPTGTFDITLKGLHTLGVRVNGVAIHEGPNMVDFGMLPEGDANNDNTINALDLAIYAAAAGKSSGQPGFDPRADFNNDGAVDEKDRVLLMINYGRSGDVALTPGPSPELGRGETALTPGSSPELGRGEAAAVANLALLPATTTVSAGQIFSLTIRVEAGALPVQAVEVHLDLPAGLTVVTHDGALVEAIEPSGVLPLVVLNHADNSLGTIDFAAAYQGTPPSGSFTLATIYLRGSLSLSSSPVRFSRLSDVVSGGASVVGTLSPAWVTVTGGPTPTPTATRAVTRTPTSIPGATRTPTATPTRPSGQNRLFLPVIVASYR